MKDLVVEEMTKDIRITPPIIDSLDNKIKEKKLKQLKPSLSRVAEKNLGGVFPYIIGLDEAGRGPLAGPVVAAACYIRSDFDLDGIEDSKQTKEADRLFVYEQMMRAPAQVLWSVCRIEHSEIDEINILQASI